MKTLSFLEMGNALKKRFPLMDLNCNSEYSSDYPKNTGFWIKGAEEITYTEKDLNTLYLSNDYFNNSYELNIYKKFAHWCLKRGYYVSSENYTLQIFKIYSNKN